MKARVKALLLLPYLLGCQLREVPDSLPRTFAYRVSQEGNRWVWVFDVCGIPRRSGIYVRQIAVWYAGTLRDAPLCATPSLWPLPNVWVHGQGLLARDGSPCSLGAGKYFIETIPDMHGAEFEIAPNGDIRVPGEQCPVPDSR